MTRKINDSRVPAMAAVALALLIGFAVGSVSAQAVPESDDAGERLSQEEIDRVVEYIVGRISEDGGLNFSGCGA